MRFPKQRICEFVKLVHECHNSEFHLGIGEFIFYNSSFKKKRTISVPLMFNLTFQNRQQNAKHLQKKSIFPRQFFDTKAWKMLSGLLWRQWSYLFVKRPGGKPGPMRPKMLWSCTYNFAYLYLFMSPIKFLTSWQMINQIRDNP